MAAAREARVRVILDLLSARSRSHLGREAGHRPPGSRPDLIPREDAIRGGAFAAGGGGQDRLRRRWCCAVARSTARILMADAARWLAERRPLCVWREPTLYQLISRVDFTRACEAAIDAPDARGSIMSATSGRSRSRNFSIPRAVCGDARGRGGCRSGQSISVPPPARRLRRWRERPRRSLATLCGWAACRTGATRGLSRRAVTDVDLSHFRVGPATPSVARRYANGLMFWFTWKKFFGSYSALTCCRRA